MIHFLSVIRRYISVSKAACCVVRSCNHHVTISLKGGFSLQSLFTKMFIIKRRALSIVAISIRLFAIFPHTYSFDALSIGHFEVFIKRDDTMRLGNHPDITGNKGRKMLELSKRVPFPSLVCSYGGHQSNSMLAIARIVASHSSNSDFVYFCKALPSFLRSKMIGNLKAASELGMKLVEVPADVYNKIVQVPKRHDEFPDNILGEYLRSMYGGSHPSVYWIPQGAAMPEAEMGVSELVDELLDFIHAVPRDSGVYRRWKVVIASGTGTMALFAARQFYSKTAALNPVLLKGWSPTAASSSSAEGLSYAIEHTTDLQVEVVAVACAGTDNDLMQQMKALDDVSGKMGIFPSILPSSLVPKRTFGELCREHLDIWRQLQRDAGIDFDLIYAPRAFEHVIASFRDNPEYWEDCGIIYYHCGGVEGNESQLGRYRHNKLL